jgi:hypothetical protein
LDCGITPGNRAFTGIGATLFFAEFDLKKAGFSVLTSNPPNKSGYTRSLQHLVKFA